jgi:hypothetical protein
MTKRLAKKCFIIRDSRADVTRLRNALRARRVSELDPGSLASVAEPLWESVQALVREADFCCAVLSGAPPPSALMFELGLAYGANKPVLILKQGDLNKAEVALPFAASYVADYEALEVHLDAFLQHGIAIRAKPTIKKRPHTALKLELPDYDATTAPGQVLERLVARAFKAEGVPVWQDDRDVGTDIAAWAQPLGGALLVEVKTAPRASEWIAQAQIRLQRAVLERAAVAGVLVYWSPGERRDPEVSAGPPLLITISAEDVVELANKGELLRTVTQLRNAFVHGG